MSSMEEEMRQKILTEINKLGHVPKRNLPLPSRSPNAPSSVGQKHPYSLLESTSKGDMTKGIDTSLSQALHCRPWDREDLIKRLATFKAMTWFAKPKVVDAVSCARKGWINVDFDTLACEVCGARLLFSIPASWNRQQVEKAARVFSIKLNSGHKLNCPWMDNACDETLVLFPPAPSKLLVNHYRERSSALMQLSALPLISTAALETMSSPQLQQFLKNSDKTECDKLPSDSSLTDELRNDCEASSASLYYQAHRVLSLCGWEPCLLPYTVDYNNQSKWSTDSGTASPSFSSSGEDSCRLIVFNSQSQQKTAMNEQSISCSTEYDPNSTVLECKLCGSRAGLWTFSTAPKPLQLARLESYTELDSGRHLGSSDSSLNNPGFSGSAVSKEPILAIGNTASLKFTIAGGPTPTRQNFKAKVSLPIVGRNLKVQLSSTSSIERHAGEEICSSYSAAEERRQCSHIETMEPSALVVEDSTTVGQIPAVTSGQDENISIKPNHHSNGKEVDLNKDTLLYISDPRPSRGKRLEFDPIRLHRHFCPWIVSTETTDPGWKQTLLALQKEKAFSVPGSEDSPLSITPLIKVDDPITSIRRLFKSPPAKRLKSLR